MPLPFANTFNTDELKQELRIAKRVGDPYVDIMLNGKLTTLTIADAKRVLAALHEEKHETTTVEVSPGKWYSSWDNFKTSAFGPYDSERRADDVAADVAPGGYPDYGTTIEHKKFNTLVKAYKDLILTAIKEST